MGGLHSTRSCPELSTHLASPGGGEGRGGRAAVTERGPRTASTERRYKCSDMDETDETK